MKRDTREKGIVFPEKKTAFFSHISLHFQVMKICRHLKCLFHNFHLTLKFSQIQQVQLLNLRQFYVNWEMWNDQKRAETVNTILSPNKILILGKVGFQSDQITAASWSGNTCQPSNQLVITVIRLLFATYVPKVALQLPSCQHIVFSL